MTRIKHLCLAALVLAVTGTAAPAFAFSDDESACFSYRSPSGIIKMCTGDMDRDRDRDRDYGYRERVYYQPVYYEPVVYRYYGPPPHAKGHHKHHNKHHNKHHECDHGRHGRDHDRDRHDD